MLVCRLVVALKDAESLSMSRRWDFTKDIYNLLNRMVGAKTEDLLPYDMGKDLEDYHDSVECVKYIAQRIRNVPNARIVKVTRSYPSVICVHMSHVDEQLRIERK